MNSTQPYITCRITDTNADELIISSIIGIDFKIIDKRGHSSGRSHIDYIIWLSEPTNKIKNILPIQKEEEDEEVCSVCLDKKVEIKLTCGHDCLCNKCYNKILLGNKKCPICRVKLDKK